MRKLLIKFPNQIRISGWDFGSSARAMNQAGVKDSLMTYESVSKTQAVRAKYARMTFERKSMSTKTSIKRIALVAVAALGFGMVSTVAANAADGDISAASGFTFGGTATARTVTTTAGANNYVGFTLATNAADYLVKVTNGTATSSATTVSGSGTAVLTVLRNSGTTAVTVPTTTEGTIVVKAYAYTAGVVATSATSSLTITVEAGTSLSTGLSTARMGDASWTAADSFTATAAAVARSGAKASGTDIAQIQVALKKNDNTADSTAHVITAFVSSGVGFVEVNTSAGTASASSRVDTVAASSGYAYVHIDSDGNAGKGEVTVQVTDAITGVTTTMGKFVYTSTGAVASIAVDTVNLSIGRKGGYALGATTSADDAAIILVLKDADGNAVSAGSAPTVVSSDVTKVVSGSCAVDADTAGYYNCSFTTATSSVSGDKATLTFKVANPAVAGTYLTATQDVTVGGSVATQTIALDAASYAPGDAMVLTVTAKDSSGNPVYDGAATPATWTSSKTVIGLPSAASTYVGGKLVYKTALYAPSAEGDFTITATGTDADATKVTASASVSGATSAALDAANEATDASNAATDAANAAAEAADAATAAAQDAQAAVAALATSVASLIAGIKAQITTLTNLVIKIQKKVKA